MSRSPTVHCHFTLHFYERMNDDDDDDDVSVVTGSAAVKETRDSPDCAYKKTGVTDDFDCVRAKRVRHRLSVILSAQPIAVDQCVPPSPAALQDAASSCRQPMCLPVSALSTE